MTDDSVRYTLGEDPHDLTILQSIQPEAVEALYATLREHRLDKIDTRPNPDADVDGTSIRMLAGRRAASASRMGHFEPEPQYAQDYEACVQALRDLVPDVSDRGVALQIEFDPSMAERRASVELDLGTDLLGVTRTPLTVHVAQPRLVTLKVRVGPPAKQLEQSIDLAKYGHALIRVDPELNEPVIELKPRAPEKPPTP
ncbi:MAG: hypothetical protein JKY37_12910 [Nannocystaceae bacterium]|nr:hypothetical protein [Nannocystaceae bacterium]